VRAGRAQQVVCYITSCLLYITTSRLLYNKSSVISCTTSRLLSTSRLLYIYIFTQQVVCEVVHNKSSVIYLHIHTAELTTKEYIQRAKKLLAVQPSLGSPFFFILTTVGMGGFLDVISNNPDEARQGEGGGTSSEELEVPKFFTNPGTTSCSAVPDKSVEPSW